MGACENKKHMENGLVTVIVLLHASGSLSLMPAPLRYLTNSVSCSLSQIYYIALRRQGPCCAIWLMAPSSSPQSGE